MKTIQLTLPARSCTLSLESRTVSGQITAYDELIPSHGMIIHSGALTTRQPLDRVKLLREHNRSDSLGYLTEIDAACENATLYVPEGENGDRALQEADDKIRDGFSIGFTFSEYAFDDDLTLHVYAGEIYEVSLVSIPAITSAGVSDVSASLDNARKDYASLMNEAQLRAALAAGTLSQDTFDALLGALRPDQRTTPEPAAPAVPAELAAGPEAQQPTAPAVQTRDRGLSLQQVSQRIAEAALTNSLQAVELALSTIVQTDDVGHGYIDRPDWIGELVDVHPEGRPFIDSLGTPVPLTSTKIEGYKIDREASKTVGLKPYAGKGAEVPTGKFKTKKVEFAPGRSAFGAEFDRIFTDLGSGDAVASLLRLLHENWQRRSDTVCAQTMLAKATDKTVAAGGAATPDSSVLGAIASGARDLRRTGGRVDRIWLGTEAFDEWSELKVADLPAWLANQLGFVNLREGTSQVGDLVLQEAPLGLDEDGDEIEIVDPKGIFLYDKRWATFHEKAPFSFETNVPRRGVIEVVQFSYDGTFDRDARIAQKRTLA